MSVHSYYCSIRFVVYLFVCSIMSLKLGTYNMRGFNNGNIMLDSLCADHDLLFVQELWLLPSNLDLFNTFNSKFAEYSVSGVIDIEQYAAKGGRPYGGVGVLWRQGAQFKCKVLGVHDSHRCVAVKISYGNLSYVCVNVYLPNFSNSDDYDEEILNCFAFIDYDSASNDDLKQKFASAYELLCCDKSSHVCEPFTVYDVRAAICNLRKGKAAGLDGVTPEMLI
jgi:hypothetical protein